MLSAAGSVGRLTIECSAVLLIAAGQFYEEREREREREREKRERERERRERDYKRIYQRAATYRRWSLAD
jgi:hypothetical protein